jgi:predicted aconitase with swiveling domain
MKGDDTMSSKVIKGHTIKKLGVVEGEAVVSPDLVAFWGGTDWGSGEIVEIGHKARGKNIAGKILVCPAGKGGAGDTFGYFYLFKSGKAPRAIICNRGQGTTLAGALLTNTPMVYGFDGDVVEFVEDGDLLNVDSDTGIVKITKIQGSAGNKRR